MERHAWFGPTFERLADIMRYPDKANEFASAKVTVVPVQAAFLLLMKCMGENTPAPRIVPTADGGLLIEILEYWVDLRMQIGPDGMLQATLGGDLEFLKKHEQDPDRHPGRSPESMLKAAVDLTEYLRKEGPPDVSAKKPDERGAAQAAVSA